MDPHNNIVTWAFVGVLIALSVASFFFYFRHPHSKDSELFLPRKYAKALILRTSKVKSQSDAFALGALCNIPEIIFTLPLYIITATEKSFFILNLYYCCENQALSKSFHLQS